MTNRRAAEACKTWIAQLIPDSGPSRRLCLLTVVQSVGFGLFLSSSAIFFRRTVGLSANEVGMGLSVAGLAGLTMTVPIGKLADRFGPRLPLLGCYAAMAVLFAAYCGVGNFPAFVVLASLISVCETSSNPLRMAVIHEVFDENQRVRVSAQMRSLFNLGFMIGAAIAGAALAVGTRPAFYAVILLTASAHVGCAVVTLRLPRREGRTSAAAEKHASRSGLRDFRFVALSLLSGVLELYQPILTVGIPLWIVGRTHASATLNSLLLMLDTVMVIVFQVAASRGAETASGASRMLRRAGLLLAASCLVFALSQGAAAGLAAGILLAGTALLVFGELSQSAGSWGLSLHLPPPGRQGEYQGVFALGRGLQQTVGPFVVTTLAVGQGRVGWLVLAALLLLAGLACPPLARSAEAARESRQPTRLEPVS